MSITEPSPATAASRRAERSRAALIRRFPDLAPVLAAPPVVQAIVSDDTVVDMGLHAGRFYGGDGRAIALRQVEDFLARPVRILQEPPVADAIGSAMERRMLSVLETTCRDLGIDPTVPGTPPTRDSGYLIVLGIGLGFHLPLLAARTGTRHLVVVETEPEFLRFASIAIDWEDLFNQIEGRGGRISLYLARSAATLAGAVSRRFEGHGTPFLDGSTLYLHYHNPTLAETAQRVIEAARLAYLGGSHYEDDQIRLTNAVANLRHGRFRVLDNRPKPPRAEPAFIIGSGPSLDANIEHVKCLREGAMVFSCGTGLRVCRHHGIVPDFHCENENTSHLSKRLAEINRSFGQADTALVASATIDPRVPPLFHETYLYFREGSFPSRVLATADQELRHAGPVAANMALRAAAAMGFRTVYLFGVDCGSRFPGRAHAQGFSHPPFEPSRSAHHNPHFDYLVPGNFGDSVATNGPLASSRLMLGALIVRMDLQVINCSNGAMIEGARPRHAADVSFAIPRLDRARVRRDIAHAHPEHPPGALLQQHSLAAARQSGQRVLNELVAETAAAAIDCVDFFSYWQRIAPLLDGRQSDSGGFPTIARGLAQATAKLAVYFLNRTSDPGLRRHLFRDFLTEFRGILAAIRDDTEILMDDLATRSPSPAPCPHSPDQSI